MNGFGFSLASFPRASVCVLVLCVLATPPCSWADTVPALNTLYNFTSTDGVPFEFSPLLQASDGDFYGVSAYGGQNSLGYVYRLSPATGQITHLHDFSFSDGATPRGPLIQASDGYLYGTTEAGGANVSDFCCAGQFYGEGACGTLFRISLAGSFTKIHDFYTAADGYQSSPNTGVIQATDGNFYGVATAAFPTVATSIFKMTQDGTLTVFYRFATDEREDYQSLAGMIQAKDGNFYGTTEYGGNRTGNCLLGGCGTVFKITPAGAETLVHAFTGTAGDGEYPQNDGLVQTADGTLYGVTGGNLYGDGYVPLCYVGGATSFSCGTLYKIDAAGNFAQLRSFGDGNGSYGLFPHASMILASDGNLYGPAIYGGGWGYGTVYRLLLNPATPILAIAGFSPPGGPPGTGVVLTGTGFSGASQLTFPGGGIAIPTDFRVDSESQITTVVPPGAQSGAISVTAPRGTTFSTTLFYLEPVIDSITPRRDRVGSGVTLLGAHFDGITSITFGGVPATKYSYVTGDDAAINVVVPRGAKSGPIVVTNSGGARQARHSRSSGGVVEP